MISELNYTEPEACLRLLFLYVCVMFTQTVMFQRIADLSCRDSRNKQKTTGPKCL